MTLSSTLTKIQYSGDGIVTAHPTTFVYYTDADLRVILTVDSTGVETVQALTTNYTLSGGNGAVGTLTMTVPPASGETLTIKSNISDLQGTSFPTGGKFPAASVERRFDIVTRLVQQQAEEISRSVALAESSETGSISLPEPSSRTALMWNTAGDNLENSTYDPDANVAAAAASASAASTSASNAATSETNAGVSETNAAASAATAALYASRSVDQKTWSGGTTMTLSQDPGSVSNVFYVEAGVPQIPGVDFTVSGTTLTRTSTPPSGDTGFAISGRTTSVGTPSDGTVGLTQLSATGTPSALTSLRGDNTWGKDIFGAQFLHIQDQKATNTHGQGLTSGSDVVRELTTVLTNEITGASLATNQITLSAGTYWIDAGAMGYQVQGHRTVIYDTTGAAIILTGTSENSYTSSIYTTSTSRVSGRVTLSAESVIELRHQVTVTNSSNGGGAKLNFGPHELYSDIKIWRIA